MPEANKIHKFFKRVDKNYHDAASAIEALIEEGDLTSHANIEISFVLSLISKLRIDFSQDSTVTKHLLEELLKGGHLKFVDNGDFYDAFLTQFKQHLIPRYSSHQSTKQQYAFSGPVVKEVLFGVSIDKDGNKSTWIQLEKHNTKTLIEFIMHLIDYIKYKFTGKNFGPFGSSVHTEHNPLIVSPALTDEYYASNQDEILEQSFSLR